jgi:GNAT superfamily N-acetyltransferase
MKRCTHPPELEAAVERVRACFPTSSDLLSKQYRTAQRATVSEGFCSVASEAVWQDAQRYGYKGRNASWHESSGERFSHWWLVSPDDCILDPTADQFSPKQLRKIYAAGKPGGFPGIRRPEGVPVVGSKARKLRERAGLGAQQTTFTEYVIRKEADSPPARSYREHLEREAAPGLFDPAGSQTVLDYTTTAYPSKRGPEMGLRCPVFNVRVTRNQRDVRAEAFLQDGARMGLVKALVRDDSTVAVNWSSMLEGGGSLDAHRTRDDYRRCGVGARLYEAVAQHACENNLVMTSDTSLRSNSAAFWERQVAKGRARYDESMERYVVLDACGIRSTGMRGLTIKSKSKRKSRRKSR